MATAGWPVTFRELSRRRIYGNSETDRRTDGQTDRRKIRSTVRLSVCPPVYAVTFGMRKRVTSVLLPFSWSQAKATSGEELTERRTKARSLPDMSPPIA